MDLGHAVSSNDKDSMATAATTSFWHDFNLFTGCCVFWQDLVSC